MNYGLLKEPNCFVVFTEINERPFCQECQSQRSRFSIKDKKFNDSYSNLFPGFSSENIKIPIDLLIVAESHGGGEENFRTQKNLEFEIAALGEYYLRKPFKKFHHKVINELLEFLDKNEKTWVFTDLIKCFVWQAVDKEKNFKGSENIDKAIKNCSKYLDDQIKTLQPQKVLSLGHRVTKKYFKLQADYKHGSTHVHKINGHSFILIFSIFPSRMSSDYWVMHDGWTRILPKLI